MRTFLRSIRAAVIFLTRVPVGGFPYSRAEWAWASAQFPLVGGLVGAATGALFAALRPSGALGAAVVAVGISMLLTGAFHEDGLADTSDALGGAFDRDKLRAILKDSRVGTFGAAALVVSIAGRAAFLARLSPSRAAAIVTAVAFVAASARVGPVWQMVALPYATEQGAKSRDVTRARVPQALVATTYAALAAGLACAFGGLSPARAMAVVGVQVGVTLVTSYRYLVRLGGISGDFLGATEQLAELAGLLVVAWGVS
jgi:adenosylcobinamide-GDP ribazoletransferase